MQLGYRMGRVARETSSEQWMVIESEGASHGHMAVDIVYPDCGQGWESNRNNNIPSDMVFPQETSHPVTGQPRVCHSKTALMPATGQSLADRSTISATEYTSLNGSKTARGPKPVELIRLLCERVYPSVLSSETGPSQ